MVDFIVEEAEDIDEMADFIVKEAEYVDEMVDFIVKEEEYINEMAYFTSSRIEKTIRYRVVWLTKKKLTNMVLL